MINMGRFWRAPKKTNIRAWKRVASGDKLWHDRSIERKAKREATKRAKRTEAHKLKMRNIKAIKDSLDEYYKRRWGRWEA